MCDEIHPVVTQCFDKCALNQHHITLKSDGRLTWVGAVGREWFVSAGEA